MQINFDGAAVGTEAWALVRRRLTRASRALVSLAEESLGPRGH